MKMQHQARLGIAPVNSARAATGAAPTITALAVALALSACAGPKVTAQDVQIARYQAETQKACFDAQARQAAGMDARDAALVIMAQALAGRGNPCGQTNVYDARAAIAGTQNRAAGQVVGSVVNGTVIGTGIVAGASVLKSAYGAAGDRTVMGDHNSVTSYDTQSTTTTRQTATGQSTTGNSTPTSGPDQRRTTTITYPQAETAE